MNTTKTLYIDAFSGISGDMLLGALLGVGAPEEALHGVVGALGLSGECELRISGRESYGVAGVDVEVALKSSREHEHRSFSHIAGMIESSALNDKIKRQSTEVFRRLGEAEARVHGVGLDEIMFHEVGAIDSIVDIVGCCALIAALGEMKIMCSPIALGGGSVKCAHGVLPVPAPAVAELLRGVPTTSGNAMFELTTPTGAALMVTLCDEFGAMPPITMEKIGYGLGKRDTGSVNALRAIIGSANGRQGGQSVRLLEANIDDMTGEELAFAAQELLSSGALDVWIQPVIMKKGRPGAVLSCLCNDCDGAALTKLFFRNTSTLGVRSAALTREIKPREAAFARTKYGEVPIKVSGERVKAEYEACAQKARENSVSLRDVSHAAETAYRRTQNEE